MSDAFDHLAYRQWEDYLLPADRDRWPALFNQIRAELTECLDYIVELEDKLASTPSPSLKCGHPGWDGLSLFYCKACGATVQTHRIAS